MYENHAQDSRISGPHDICQTVSHTWGAGGNNLPLVLNDQGGDYMNVSNDLIGTLRSDMGGHLPTVFACRMDQVTSHGLGIRKNAAYTLDRAASQAICLDRSSFNQGQNAQFDISFQSELAQTVVSKGPCAVANGKTVRRLTPVECERLQGFPDNWTAFRANGRPIADSKRYAAIGNSIAIPCVEYIMAGIAAANDN
jgi:DNA (cytosine-5)-methyltransferase 1